eukprot:scaffold26_cov117-Cylindrotheca_fusiformis.AAC.1
MSINNKASVVDPSLEKKDLVVAQGNECVQHERNPHTKIIFAADAVAIQDELTSSIKGTDFGSTTAVLGVGMICNACGIYGAWKFHQGFIVVAALWSFEEFIQGIASEDGGGAIVSVLFRYPHDIFYDEVSHGNMIPASYPQEQHCRRPLILPR